MLQRGILSRIPSNVSENTKKTLRFDAVTRQFIKHDSGGLNINQKKEMHKKRAGIKMQTRISNFLNYVPIGNLFELTMDCL